MTDSSPTIVDRFMSMKPNLLTVVGALIVIGAGFRTSPGQRSLDSASASQ
jgi:hypothetical protein